MFNELTALSSSKQKGLKTESDLMLKKQTNENHISVHLPRDVNPNEKTSYLNRSDLSLPYDCFWDLAPSPVGHLSRQKLAETHGRPTDPQITEAQQTRLFPKQPHYAKDGIDCRRTFEIKCQMSLATFRHLHQTQRM